MQFHQVCLGGDSAVTGTPPRVSPDPSRMLVLKAATAKEVQHWNSELSEKAVTQLRLNLSSSSKTSECSRSTLAPRSVHACLSSAAESLHVEACS